MKKTALLFFFLVLMMMSSSVYAKGIDIYIDDTELECEEEPINSNGRVLVPMRSVFEAFGAEVTWNGEERKVQAESFGEIIDLTIDSNKMSIGVINSDGAFVVSDTIELDVPPQIINDRTYVPIRAVSESLGAFVSWDGNNNNVLIDTRPEMSGNVYYTSDSDYQKLYSVLQNGMGREKISDRSVYDIETYQGYVYYLAKDNNFLFRANIYTGEEQLTQVGVNKICISDGYVYYQDLDGGRESGIVYRMNVDTGEVQKLTQEHVKYPRIYKNYLYYNVDGENKMYYTTVDGTAAGSISLGDENFVKLHTVNCKFFGDYIFVEDGVHYGGITRISLDGSEVKRLTIYNSLMFNSQPISDKVLYLKPEEGYDIYCINTDGSDEHLVAEVDDMWLGVSVLDGRENTIYYKNPMHQEIYKVNLDGSENSYFCYGDDLKVLGEKMILSYDGVYILNSDGSSMTKIYNRSVKDMTVIDNKAYYKDKNSSRLYISDTDGKNGMVTADSVGEWAVE